MRRLMMDFAAAERGLDNTTSAADLVDVLAEIATGARLGADVTAPVLASLELQEHLDGLPRYLPARHDLRRQSRRRPARRPLRARLRHPARRVVDRR